MVTIFVGNVRDLHIENNTILLSAYRHNWFLFLLLSINNLTEKHFSSSFPIHRVRASNHAYNVMVLFSSFGMIFMFKMKCIPLWDVSHYHDLIPIVWLDNQMCLISHLRSSPNFSHHMIYRLLLSRAFSVDTKKVTKHFINENNYAFWCEIFQIIDGDYFQCCATVTMNSNKKEHSKQTCKLCGAESNYASIQNWFFFEVKRLKTRNIQSVSWIVPVIWKIYSLMLIYVQLNCLVYI